MLRILFATLVLLSHAPEITDGNTTRELLHRLTGSITFGTFGVDGFFVLSGYLIVQSWLADPVWLNFLRKRVLRILPGYLVAAGLSTIAIGLLAPGVADFFRGLDMHFIRSLALLGSPATPPVFPGRPYAMVNGALYTIAYEFRCYLLVALLGWCGLLRRPKVILAVTVLLLMSSLLFPTLLEDRHWPRPVEALAGQPAIAVRLTAIYLVGVCFHLFRDRIAFRQWLALAAATVLMGGTLLVPSRTEIVFVLCGSYLLFYLGQMVFPALADMGKFPDISYGIYLYGWPVESLLIWYQRGSPWIAFAASTVICVVLGWLSWHFVERPALALKRRPAAPEPALSVKQHAA